MEEIECSASQPESTILSNSVLVISCSESTDGQVKENVKPDEFCNSLENGSHVKEKAGMDVTASTVECQALGRTPNQTTIVDVHTLKACIQESGNLQNMNNQSSLVITENAAIHRELEEQKFPEISVHKNQTDNRQTQQKDLISSNCKTNELIHLSKNQDVSSTSTVHKQTTQPHGTNAPSFCRAGNVGNQVQQNCVQMIASIPAHVSGHCMVVEAPCYSPCHHAVVKDTFAAFCHPQPIPAPARFIPRPPSTDGEYMSQKVRPACLALPPLISAISETRLDSKRLTHCCSLDCNWPSALCQTKNQRQAAKQGGKNTKDAGTMTSCKELRDVGVQVSQTDCKKSPQHVFPEVCLADEKDSGSSKLSTQKKTKVKEVKWDAEGMTWEVYGASVDPEELGLAIQKHLEIQIKETSDKAVKLSKQNTVTKKTGKNKSQRGKSSIFAASFCCTGSSGVSD